MKTTDELRQGEPARRAEEFRSASQDRDVERMLALFADDAQVLFTARSIAVWSPARLPSGPASSPAWVTGQAHRP